MVVYQAMYDTFQIYVRPLDMFMEEVDRVKYPDVKQKYRFELLRDIELAPPVQEERFRHAEPAEREKSLVQEEPQADATVIKQAETSEQTESYSMLQEQRVVRTDESDEQINIDPLVMEFLDADTYEQRLNILAALRHRITDEMINTMAVAVDLEIKDGDVEERYEELKNCLLTFEKYECNRLR